MSSLRVGIIGFGLAGEVFHAPLVAAVDGLEVAVVVTRDAGRQTTARAAYPFAEVTPDVERVWDLDLAVIATPNRAHVPLALTAVERGVPVVVDKPLAPSAAEAQRLVDASAAAGVALTVFQNRRWDGDFLTLRRLVADGTLGDVVRFESRFERFRPEVQGDRWREAAGAEEAGGQLFDLGPHLVDQARELFGHPTHVYADVGARRPGAGVDDDAFLVLHHPGGVRSHLSMGVVAPVPAPRFAVTGLAGGFSVEGLDPQEPQLAAGLRPGGERFGLRDAPGVLHDEEGGRPVEIERGRYEDFYAAVRDALAGDGPLPVDPADSVAGLRILEAARRSAAEGRVVGLG